jgi:hypothetical protein
MKSTHRVVGFPHASAHLPQNLLDGFDVVPFRLPRSKSPIFLNDVSKIGNSDSRVNQTGSGPIKPLNFAHFTPGIAPRLGSL